MTATVTGHRFGCVPCEWRWWHVNGGRVDAAAAAERCPGGVQRLMAMNVSDDYGWWRWLGGWAECLGFLRALPALGARVSLECVCVCV